MRAVRAVRKIVIVMAVAAALLGITPRNGSGSEGSAWGNDPAVVIVDDNGICANLKPAPTAVSVDLVVAPTLVDNKKTWAELISNSQYVRKLSLENSRLKEIWSVNDLETAGMAYGGIDSIFSFELAKESVDQYGAYYCLYFKTASVQLLYRTMVHIPSNFAPDSCAYAVIDAHEQMLVDANKQAIETYVERLRQDIPGIIAQIETGFSSRNTIPSREAKMRADIQEAINIYINDTLLPKMKQLVAIINTPEELALRKAALENCKNAASGKTGQ
jgi:hypothetical protein